MENVYLIWDRDFKNNQLTDKKPENSLNVNPEVNFFCLPDFRKVLQIN